jgi:hypothetical protein
LLDQVNSATKGPGDLHLQYALPTVGSRPVAPALPIREVSSVVSPTEFTLWLIHRFTCPLADRLPTRIETKCPGACRKPG